MMATASATSESTDNRRLIEHEELEFYVPHTFNSITLDPVIVVPQPFITVGDEELHDRGTDYNVVKVTVVALRVTIKVTGSRFRQEEWGFGVYFKLVAADFDEVALEQ